MDEERKAALARVRVETVARFKEVADLAVLRDFSLRQEGEWFRVVFDGSLGCLPAWPYEPEVRYDLGRKAWQCRIGSTVFWTQPCPFFELIVESRGYLLPGLPAPDAVIVDAGPWTGITGMYLAARARQGRIVFVEPEPGSVEALERHVALNGFSHCEIVQAALARGRGTARLAVRGGGESRLDPGGGLEVPTLGILDLVADAGLTRLDLLKLDIEGAEVEIAEDLPRLLERFPGALVAVASYHEAAGRQAWEAIEEALAGVRHIYMKTAYPYHVTTFLCHAGNAALRRRIEALTGLGQAHALAERARTGKRFVKRRVEVEEAGKTRVHGPEAARPDLPQAGAVWLIGMPGSGRSRLGRAVAQRLQARFLELEDPSPDEVERLSREGPVVAGVAASALADDTLRAALRRTGRVFYLMAVPALGQSGSWAQSASGPEGIHVYEPLFMQTLHFVVSDHGSDEDKVTDILEKLRL